MKCAALRRFLGTVAFAVATSACGGGNVFHDPNSRKDPVEEAIQDLETGNADGAISIMQNLLISTEVGSDRNAELTSILASGHLLKHKIDLVSMVVALADAKKEIGIKPLLVLFNYLPAPTKDNISGIETAIDLLLSIDRSKRNTIDDVKLTIALLADLGLRLKALDVNGDGIISLAEAKALSRAEADAMAAQLASVAYAVIAHYTTGLPSAEAALSTTSAKVSDLQADVQSEPGSSDGEKLGNYVQDHASDVGSISAPSLPSGSPPSPSVALPGGDAASVVPSSETSGGSGGGKSSSSSSPLPWY